MYIDVPDIIDINHMRSKGVQPGEKLLPETGNYCKTFQGILFGLTKSGGKRQ